jgi:peptidoglycan hydrolase-like protein with peptidoglycan-binding domain
MMLKLGNLNPISQVSGLKARLANLGLYKGPNDENLDAATKQAISAFQKKKGLPVTGIADDATNAQINKTHGH